jgi:hypothetical protein
MMQGIANMDFFTMDVVKNAIRRTTVNGVVDAEACASYLNDHIKKYGLALFGIPRDEHWNMGTSLDGQDTHYTLMLPPVLIREEKCDHQFPSDPLDDFGKVQNDHFKRFVDGAVSRTMGVCAKCGEKI